MSDVIMKILLIAIIHFAVLSYSFAQNNKQTVYDISDSKTEKLKAGHLTDVKGNKFVGKWVCKEAGSKFTVLLTKYTHKFGKADNAITMELLKGSYSYIVNGREIAKAFDSDPITGSTEGNTDLAYLLIFNTATKKTTEFKITYLNNDVIKWELSTRLREGSENKNDLNLPTDITLVKAK